MLKYLLMLVFMFALPSAAAAPLFTDGVIVYDDTYIENKCVDVTEDNERADIPITIRQPYMLHLWDDDNVLLTTGQLSDDVTREVTRLRDSRPLF